MGSCYLFFDSAGQSSSQEKSDNPVDQGKMEKVVGAIDKSVNMVIGHRSWKNAFSADSTVSHYASITDYALALCRKHHLTRNDRSVFLTTEETLLKISLILGRLEKEAYGAEELLVSDVLDVFAKIKLARIDGEDPDGEDGLQGKAALEYLNNLKTQNLVDVWSLLRFLQTTESDEVKSELKGLNCLLVSESIGDRKSGEIELCKVLFGTSPHEIAQEVPLDASFSASDSVADFSLVETSWTEVQSKVNRLHIKPTLKGSTATTSMPKDRKYTLQLVLGYFRLLINSRDEIALSRVVSGPGGILNHAAFNVIRKQAHRTKTPMYQPMVSFVQRSRLGGKFPDLGPNEVHPFEPFKKELFEFNDLMDKAQELVEEVKDGEAFARKICQCFKSHIAKSCAAGKVNQRWKMSHLDATLSLVTESMTQDHQHQSEMKNNGSASAATPKRSVGDGGSIGGRKNFKTLRRVVDTFSTSVLNGKVDLHKMLGKVEDTKDTSELEMSAKKTSGLSPGANYPSVITLFRSPGAEESDDSNKEAEDDIGTGLAERLGVTSPIGKKRQKASKASSNSAKRREDKGKPKFGCSLAWAQDTSPIVAPSPNTPGPKDDSADVMGASPKLASIRGSMAGAPPPKVSKVPSRFDAALQDEDSCDAVAAAPSSSESDMKLVLEDDAEEDRERKMRIMIDKARCEAELMLDAAKKGKKPSKASGPAKRSILQDINKATKDLNRIEKKKGLSVVDEVDGITESKPVQAKETKKRKAVPTGEENSKSEQQPKKTKTAGPKPKKGLVPLKGQMKMTAFMLRM